MNADEFTEAAIQAEALRDAADAFKAHQQQLSRERQELRPWSVACAFLRDRADRIEASYV